MTALVRDPTAPTIRALISLARPHQWVKNTFVFAGLIFSRKWGQEHLLLDALFTAIAFCLASSAVYAINDVVDQKIDRQHPKKCYRPVAAGTISSTTAYVYSGLLALSAIVIAANITPAVTLFIGTYLCLNLVYTIRVKHVVLLDVFFISGGFMLRILAGSNGLGIPPSRWMLLSTLMLTLLLGLTKRRSEATRRTRRKVLENYPIQLLDTLIAITAGCTIMTYGLYTIAPETVALHNTNRLVYTLPVVVYGIFRYLYIVYQWAEGEDTSKLITRDPHLLVAGSIWVCMVMALIKNW